MRLVRCTVALLVLCAGCGGMIDSTDDEKQPTSDPAAATHRVQGTLTLTVGDASGPDRPRTGPLASTRVFLMPLVSCEQVHGRSITQLELAGSRSISSTYSREDGSFELTAPSGVYSFFAAYEGLPLPRSSSRGECNRVDIKNADVTLPPQATRIDVSM